MTEPVLRLHDLEIGYRHRGELTKVLHGLDLTLGQGEFVALVGESGSGKSTTAAAVTGLLPAAAEVLAGGVELGGREITRLSERRMSRVRGRAVGLIPQDPGASLNPVLTIGTQVEEIFKIRGERLSAAERRRRAVDLLRTAEVSRAADRLDQYPHELSGGLKQRILIAIAFGLDPALIVADEPTSALDVTVQRQVLRVFDRLAADHGTSILFVTHDVALATDHASRVVVMRDGRIVEDAATEHLVRAPRSEYARGLIAHARAAEAEPAGPAPEGAEVLRLDGTGVLFPARGASPAHRATEDVSLVLRAGETVALVGESGSGKSTTARVALRLLDATEGRVIVRGRDVTDVSGRARRALWRDIQLVYQNPDSALDPRWQVQDIIAEPLRGTMPAQAIRARVAELLEAVALPAELATRRPGRLSGGQRQRVAIARALAPASSVVVLDEALSALDVITQEQVLALLVRLQSELGLSYLFISHDLSVVRRIAHRVVVLREGRIVESGDTEEVFAAPRTDYVRELIAAIPGGRHLHPDEPTGTPATDHPIAVSEPTV